MPTDSRSWLPTDGWVQALQNPSLNLHHSLTLPRSGRELVVPIPENANLTIPIQSSPDAAKPYLPIGPAAKETLPCYLGPGKEPLSNKSCGRSPRSVLRDTEVPAILGDFFLQGS